MSTFKQAFARKDGGMFGQPAQASQFGAALGLDQAHQAALAANVDGQYYGAHRSGAAAVVAKRETKVLEITEPMARQLGAKFQALVQSPLKFFISGAVVGGRFETYAPDSAQAKAQAAQDASGKFQSSIGILYMQNPTKSSGRLRVGSKQFLTLLEEADVGLQQLMIAALDAAGFSFQARDVRGIAREVALQYQADPAKAATGRFAAGAALLAHKDYVEADPARLAAAYEQYARNPAAKPARVSQTQRSSWVMSKKAPRDASYQPSQAGFCAIELSGPGVSNTIMSLPRVKKGRSSARGSFGALTGNSALYCEAPQDLDSITGTRNLYGKGANRKGSFKTADGRALFDQSVLQAYGVSGPAQEAAFQSYKAANPINRGTLRKNVANTPAGQAAQAAIAQHQAQIRALQAGMSIRK